MTLWVKQVYLDLVEYANQSKNPQHKLNLDHLHRVLYHPLRAVGLVNCYHTDYYLEPNDQYRFYISYDHFLNNIPSYSISRRELASYCEWNKEYIGHHTVKVFLTTPKGRVVKTVCRDLARCKIKTDWWYDKARDVYTDFLFDYPAYNERYKGSPRFWRQPGDREVYGHEFELKFASYGDKLAFANQIKDKYRPCITEKDGSLDGGLVDGGSLELITPPWSYEESLANLSGIFSLAQTHQVRMMNNGYAWHITVNLLNASDPVRAGNRLMTLFNDPSLRIFWQQIARRYSQINHSTGRNYCKFEDGASMDKGIWMHRWGQNPIDHYYVTFLRKCGTAIEIRLLKSTVDFSVFSATLDIIRAAWLWAKGSEPLESWFSILDGLSPDTCKYIQQAKQTTIKKIRKIPQTLEVEW